MQCGVKNKAPISFKKVLQLCQRKQYMTANCTFLETARIPLTLRDIQDLRDIRDNRDLRNIREDFSLISEMDRIIGVSSKIQFAVYV